MPDYVRPDHLVKAESDAPGRVEVLRFTSELQGFERKVHVYLPPDYWQSRETTYPLLIVHDGKDWLEKGHMVPALDHLIVGGSRPLIVALLEARDEWWEEAGGTGTDEHVEMLVGELLPLLQRNYRIIETAETRGLMGNTGFGLTSAYAALKHPELFGKVAIQSVQLGLGYEDPLMALLASEPRPEIDFYLDWSRYEVRNLDAGIDLSVDNRRLAEALRAAGYEFAGGEVRDSAGWAGWSARTDSVLEALFPN
jgi:enterochelin esterase-like enzyme